MAPPLPDHQTRSLPIPRSVKPFASTWLSDLRWRRSASVVLVACFGTPLAAQHDCVPYEGTKAGAVSAAEWSAQLEQDDYQFTVPADLGGGYVVVNVSSTAPAQPRMRIVPPSGLGVVTQAGTSFPGPSQYFLEVAFEVDAGATYEVQIIEDVNAPIEDHPVPYEWSWTFFSKVDCYEENDGKPSDWPAPIGTARTVPFNQVLEAHSLAGYLDFGIEANAAHGFDWYHFTLLAPTQLWFATVSVASDQRLRLRLFDDGGLTLLDPPLPSVGQGGVSDPILLPAGDYYLALNTEVRGETEVTLSEGETLPDHFNHPYQFIVSTDEIPPCGLSSIFCDGFESGDTNDWTTATP